MFRSSLGSRIERVRADYVTADSIYVNESIWKTFTLGKTTLLPIVTQDNHNKITSWFGLVLCVQPESSALKCLTNIQSVFSSLCSHFLFSFLLTKNKIHQPTDLISLPFLISHPSHSFTLPSFLFLPSLLPKLQLLQCQPTLHVNAASEESETL